MPSNEAIPAEIPAYRGRYPELSASARFALQLAAHHEYLDLPARTR